MSTRLKLIVAYDGAPFAGWQSQLHRNTVQDHLEQALAAVLGAPVRVHGSGRTDSGVHALAQCAHVDVPSRRLDPRQWIAAINDALPPQIRILRCSYVSANFHARYSAAGKTYRYRICTSDVLPPHEYLRCWHLQRDLDVAAMQLAAAAFIGAHDFVAFAAKRGGKEENTVRTIELAHLKRRGPMITFDVTGNGFLYKMVRLMVGTLVRVGTGAAAADNVAAMLRDPGIPTKRLVAPAAGLYLVRVRY